MQKPVPEAVTNERREHLWAVIGAHVLSNHRHREATPSTWPQTTAQGFIDHVGQHMLALGHPDTHPLDLAYALLSALPLNRDAADIELVVEAARAERLKQQLATYQQALLTLLDGSPADRGRLKARTLARYGRDLFAELQADQLSADDLAMLLPWPPQRH